MARQVVAERANTLRQQRQQVTADALVEAARRAMIEHGLDVTVDDIARLAGVGRRTVFRYFATREDLLRAALDKSFAAYVSALPEYGGGDWLEWITQLTLVSHRSVANAGRLLWELRTRRVPVDTWKGVQRVFDDVTATVWRAAGGGGRPPRELRQTVAAHLSPMFTQAVLLDAGGTPELAAELAAGAIAATLRQLLGADRS